MTDLESIHSEFIRLFQEETTTYHLLEGRHDDEEIFERSDYKDGYEMVVVDLCYQGFLMAKRSQPVIELPSVFDFRENPSYSLAILQNHLEDIGIKFRVKE